MAPRDDGYDHKLDPDPPEPAAYTPETSAPPEPPRPLWRDVALLVLRVVAWVTFLVLLSELLRIPDLR